MNVKIYDIDWDCYANDIILPTEIVLNIPSNCDMVNVDDKEGFLDFLSDYLSDTFCWHPKGFNYDIQCTFTEVSKTHSEYLKNKRNTTP